MSLFGRKKSPVRRYVARDFQERIRQAKARRRIAKPIDLSRKSRWAIVLGFRSKLFRLLWAGIFALLVYLFVFSKLMIVSDVTVTGTARTTPDEIASVIRNMDKQRVFFIPSNNFFLLDRQRASDAVITAVPYVKEITKFKRSWPNKVSIEVLERDPGFILESNNSRYLVDDDGVVVMTDPQDSGLPKVIDQVNENFDIGEPFPNPKSIAFILTMFKQWDSKVGIGLSEAKIPGKASSEVQFVTSEGWGVFFDTTRSVPGQLSSLTLILSKQISLKDRPNLSYIDLRLSKWAYYCFKNTPCVESQPIEPVENLSETVNGASTEQKTAPVSGQSN